MRIFYVLVFLLLIIKTKAGTIIQLKDFLCGCEYCVTVPTQEPLDIGRHMIMCHSWRDATLKTMKIMEQMKKPEIKIKKREEKPDNKKIKEQLDEHVDIYNDYKWRKDEAYGWTYSTTYQTMNLKDMWRYLEDLGWVWSFGREKKFLYSENHGWIYNTIYKSKRVLYFYDRRIWMLASRARQEYQE